MKHKCPNCQATLLSLHHISGELAEDEYMCETCLYPNNRWQVLEIMSTVIITRMDLVGLIQGYD